MASYKSFHGNVLRDTYFITGVTAGTAIFSGFVIFSVIGFMAHALDKEVEEVAAEVSYKMSILNNLFFRT